MKMISRPMEKQDIPRVCIIEELSFLTPWTKQSLEGELKNQVAQYLVLEEEKEQRIVGYAGLWKVLDEGHITNVAIHPDYRGVGAGHRLLTDLEEVAKKEGIRVLFLEVREHNIPAQELYRKHGFIMVGLRRGYYSDSKEDAILMEKTMEIEGGE